MFIITDENMLKTDYDQEINHSNFDPIADIQILAQQENWCMVRTEKLLPTLRFMQQIGWKIWELIPDDEFTE
jgi:hypothetical protein